VNQSHPFDGTTPLGISLLFGHHDTVSLQLLRLTAAKPAVTVDLAKCDLKGRSLLHLALLSPPPSRTAVMTTPMKPYESAVEIGEITGVTPATPQPGTMGYYHFYVLPEVISGLLGTTTTTTTSSRGATTAHERMGRKGVEVMAEVMVKGQPKTAVRILLDKLGTFARDLEGCRFARWRHLAQYTSGDEPRWRQQDDIMREAVVDLEASQAGLAECLRRVMEHPSVAQRLTSMDYSALCDEICEAGAWGCLPMVEFLLGQVVVRELVHRRHLGTIFERACELGALDLALFVLDTVAASPPQKSAALADQLLAGLKLAVVSRHESFFISLLGHLSPLATVVDWNSSKPDGVPLLHLLINFGMSAACARLLALSEVADHLDLNRQSDVRAPEDVRQDDLPCTAKIHRTACLTPYLAVVRTGWLKAAMLHYDARMASLSSSSSASTSRFDHKSPVPCAFLQGRAGILQCLVQQERVSLRQQGVGNESLTVHEAARCGNFGAMVALLDRFPSLDVNQVDYLGHSVLYFAVMHRSVMAVRYLVHLRGLEVNHRALDATSPLHLAVHHNLVDIAQLLLAGPSAHLVDPNLPVITLHSWRKGWATQPGVMVDVFALRTSESTSTSPGPGSAGYETPLHLACALGHHEIVRELVRHRATRVNAVSDQGTTPLAVAAISGTVDCVRELLAHPNIEIFSHDREGSTPLHLAAKNDHQEILSLLLDSADPSLVGEDLLETIIRFCPGVLGERFEGSVWKENLSRASSSFSYVCDWTSSFMSEAASAQDDGQSLKGKRAAVENTRGRRPPPVRVAFLLNTMVAFNANQLLETTLVRTIVDLKWARYRLFGFTSLVLYLLYLGCFTLLALWPAVAATTFVDLALRLALLALSAAFLVFELFSLVATPEMVANDWTLPRRSQRALFSVSLALRKVVFYSRRPQNWLKLFAFAVSLLFSLHLTFPGLVRAASSEEATPPTAGETLFSSSSSPPPSSILLSPFFVSNVVPLAVLVAWLTSLYYLRTTTFLGVRVDLHVQMYLRVLRSILSSFLLFAVLLCGFGVTLVLLTSPSTTTTFGYAPVDNSTTSAQVINALKVLVFTSFGDLQFSEQLSPSTEPEEVQVALLVAIAFLVMCPLVAFNFLVALAVGDVNTLKEQAQIEGLRTRASTIATVDHLLASARLLGCLRRDLPADGRIYPNKTGLMVALLSFLGLVGEEPLCEYPIPTRSKEGVRNKGQASKKESEDTQQPLRELVREQRQIITEMTELLSRLRKDERA